jgi:hypothetical protein
VALDESSFVDRQLGFGKAATPASLALGQFVQAEVVMSSEDRVLAQINGQLIQLAMNTEPEVGEKISLQVLATAPILSFRVVTSEADLKPAWDVTLSGQTPPLMLRIDQTAASASKTPSAWPEGLPADIFMDQEMIAPALVSLLDFSKPQSAPDGPDTSWARTPEGAAPAQALPAPSMAQDPQARAVAAMVLRDILEQTVRDILVTGVASGTDDALPLSQSGLAANLAGLQASHGAAAMQAPAQDALRFASYLGWIWPDQAIEIELDQRARREAIGEFMNSCIVSLRLLLPARGRIRTQLHWTTPGLKIQIDAKEDATAELLRKESGAFLDVLASLNVRVLGMAIRNE